MEIRILSVPYDSGQRGVRMGAGPGRLPAEFEADWQSNLLRLLPPEAEVEFEDAWERVVDYVTRMAEGPDQGSQGVQ